MDHLTTGQPCSRRFVADPMDDGRHLVLCACGWYWKAPSRRQGKARWSEHRWHVKVAELRAAGTLEDRPRKSRDCTSCGKWHPSNTGLCLACATAKGLVKP